MTTLRRLLLESSSESLQDRLDALVKRHPNLSVSLFPPDPGTVYLNSVMALKGSPPGTGSNFMRELCELADREKLVITLQTANKQPGSSRPGKFKTTTSGDRLKAWYKRFGFLMNSKHGRFDLRGNMFRPPSVASSNQR